MFLQMMKKMQVTAKPPGHIKIKYKLINDLEEKLQVSQYALFVHRNAQLCQEGGTTFAPSLFIKG